MGHGRDPDLGIQIQVVDRVRKPPNGALPHAIRRPCREQLRALPDQPDGRLHLLPQIDAQPRPVALVVDDGGKQFGFGLRVEPD